MAMQVIAPTQLPKVQTIKAKKELENAEAVGGMRSPALAVGMVPGLRIAGLRVRKAIEEHCTANPELLKDIVSSAGFKKDLVDESRIDALAE